MSTKQQTPKTDGDSGTSEKQSEQNTSIRVSTPAVRRMRGENEPQALATSDAPEQPAVEGTSATAEDAEQLVVFAFRLTTEERNAIHKAAGPSNASKFVRTLAVAAAKNDETAVKAIMSAAHAAE